MERHYTYSEVSEMLGIKVGTLYSLVSRQRIPHVRLGRRFVRFPEKELREWALAHFVAPAG